MPKPMAIALHNWTYSVGEPRHLGVSQPRAGSKMMRDLPACVGFVHLLTNCQSATCNEWYEAKASEWGRCPVGRHDMIRCGEVSTIYLCALLDKVFRHVSQLLESFRHDGQSSESDRDGVECSEMNAVDVPAAR